jgi:hypothetical protein
VLFALIGGRKKKKNLPALSVAGNLCHDGRAVHGRWYKMYLLGYNTTKDQ